MKVKPTTLRFANEYVRQNHRHSKIVQGCRFCIAAIDSKETILKAHGSWTAFINEYEEIMTNYLDEYKTSKKKYDKTKIYKDKIKPMLYEKILHNLKQFLYYF